MKERRLDEARIAELVQCADDVWEHDQQLNFDTDGSRLRQAVGEDAMWLDIRLLLAQLRESRAEVAAIAKLWPTVKGYYSFNQPCQYPNGQLEGIPCECSGCLTRKLGEHIAALTPAPESG